MPASEAQQHIRDVERLVDTVHSLRSELTDLRVRLFEAERQRDNFFLCTGCGIGAADEDACCVTCGRDCLVVVDGRLLDGHRDELEAERDAAIAERDLHIDAFAAQKRERDAFKAEVDRLRLVYEAAERWADALDFDATRDTGEMFGVETALLAAIRRSNPTEWP